MEGLVMPYLEDRDGRTHAAGEGRWRWRWIEWPRGAQYFMHGFHLEMTVDLLASSRGA